MNETDKATNAMLKRLLHGALYISNNVLENNGHDITDVLAVQCNAIHTAIDALLLQQTGTRQGVFEEVPVEFLASMMTQDEVKHVEAHFYKKAIALNTFLKNKGLKYDG